MTRVSLQKSTISSCALDNRFNADQTHLSQISVKHIGAYIYKIFLLK